MILNGALTSVVGPLRVTRWYSSEIQLGTQCAIRCGPPSLGGNDCESAPVTALESATIRCLLYEALFIDYLFVTLPVMS
jgi:hypothetical protein